MAVNIENQKSVAMDFAFDAEGKQVDGPSWAQACSLKLKLVAWRSLAQTILSPGPRSTLKPTYEKPNDRVITEPHQKNARLERLKVIQCQKAKIVDTLKHVGTTVDVGNEPGNILPFVSASLRAEDVYKLKRVLYNDCSVDLEIRRRLSTELWSQWNGRPC